MTLPLDLVGADVLGDATGLAGHHVFRADAVEQQGLAVVDVAHDGHDRRPGTQLRLVLFLVVVVEELGQQLGLALLARVDQAHLGAELGREQLDHVVGQRLGGRDHLPLEEQEADDVAGRTVQLGAEVAGGRAALDDDLVLGHRRRGRRVGGEGGRLQLFEVPTTPTGATLVGTATSDTGTATSTGTAAGASWAATGTAAGTASSVATAGATGTSSVASAGGPGGTSGAGRAGTAGTGTAGTAGEPAGTLGAGRGTPSAGPGGRRNGLAGDRAGWAAGRGRDRTAGRAGRRAHRARPRLGRGGRGGRGRRGSGGRRRRRPEPVRQRPGRRGADGSRGGGRGRSRGGRRRSRVRRCGCRCRWRAEPERWLPGQRGRRPAGVPVRRVPGQGRRRQGPPVPVPGGGGRRCGTRLLGGRTAGDQAGAGALDRGRRHGSGTLVGGGAVGAGGRGGRLGDGRGLLGRGLLGGGLLGRGFRLLGLDGTTEALAVGLPTGAVGLRVLDGRRVALDAHPEGQAEVKRLLVGQAELMSELVYPDFLRQRLLLPFLRCRRCQSAHTTLHPRTS